LNVVEELRKWKGKRKKKMVGSTGLMRKIRDEEDKVW